MVEDARYGTVTVASWSGLHPKLGRRGRWTGRDTLPIVRGTVIRVEVQHLPKPTARTKKTLWLWWSGPGTPDLDICWRAYLRRFDIEHTYRFAKNTLGWTTPRICSPEQADRWTWLIVAAYTQLRLAPAASSPTTGCPGRNPANPTNSPPPASDEDFEHLPPSSAPPPVHQNPTNPAQDDPKAPEPALEPVTPPSRRPPEV